MQAKILRVLQERVVTPLGGKSAAIDVRIIAATHRDLTSAVRQGSFREDLFYRLGVVPVHVPPLRERLADIVPLAEHFLGRAGNGKRLAADAASRLLAYPWPGNVRELRNAMERVAVLVRQPVIRARKLAFLAPGALTADVDWLEGDLPTAVARLEAALIRRALEFLPGQPHGSGAPAEHPSSTPLCEDAALRSRCVRSPDGRRPESGRRTSALGGEKA